MKRPAHIQAMIDAELAYYAKLKQTLPEHLDKLRRLAPHVTAEQLMADYRKQSND